MTEQQTNSIVGSGSNRKMYVTDFKNVARSTTLILIQLAKAANE